jgi:hypothetical protein
MRRWLTASAQAGSHVADHSGLWLSGALAWMVTVGWLALIAAVARPPTAAELTFLGADAFTSGLWPWNGIAIVIVALLLIGLAIILASIAEAVLLHGRRATTADVRATFVVGVICVIPLLVATVALGAALFVVAPGTFNDPNPDGGPLLRTIVELAPFAAAMLLAAMLGSAVHAAATRARPESGGAWSALAAAPRSLGRGGTAAVVQIIAHTVARIGFLVVATVLLRVLWAPIEARLSEEGFGIAGVLLLVGFVAIWLCLVLAGGALHAWGSVSWTRLLEARGRDAGAVAPMESRSRP